MLRVVMCGFWRLRTAALRGCRRCRKCVCEDLDRGGALLLLVGDGPSLVGTDRVGPVERQPSHSLMWIGMSHNHDIVGAHLVEYAAQRFTGFDDHDYRCGSAVHRTVEVAPQRILGGAFCEQRLQEHLVAAWITVHGADLGAYPDSVDNGFQMFDPSRQLTSADAQQLDHAGAIPLSCIIECGGAAGAPVGERMKGDRVAVGVVAVGDVLSFLCAVFHPAGLEVAAAIEALDGCTDGRFRVGQHWWHSFAGGSCWHRVWLPVSISGVAPNVFTADAQISGPASRNCHPPGQWWRQFRPAGRDSVDRPLETTLPFLSNKLGHSRFGKSDAYARIGVIVCASSSPRIRGAGIRYGRYRRATEASR